jgi:hypothetical protein
LVSTPPLPPVRYEDGPLGNSRTGSLFPEPSRLRPSMPERGPLPLRADRAVARDPEAAIEAGKHPDCELAEQMVASRIGTRSR